MLCAAQVVGKCEKKSHKSSLQAKADSALKIESMNIKSSQNGRLQIF
jgi:hypothetical protein